MKSDDDRIWSLVERDVPSWAGRDFERYVRVGGAIEIACFERFETENEGILLGVRLVIETKRKHMGKFRGAVLTDGDRLWLLIEGSVVSQEIHVRKIKSDRVRRRVLRMIMREL